MGRELRLDGRVLTRVSGVAGFCCVHVQKACMSFGLNFASG